MDLIELETRAKHGQDYPPDLTWEEKELYRDFRCLYFMLKAKMCTVEEAKTEKAEILKQYEGRKKFRDWVNDSTDRMAAICGIIKRWDDPDKMPRKTWKYVMELFENCLLPKESCDADN